MTLFLGSIEQEEDIGWEDDDDEATSPTTTKPSRIGSQQETKPDSTSQTTITQADTAAASTEQHLLAPAAASTPGSGSPRDSSEESYDMLSSSRTSNVGEPPVKVKERAKKAEEDEDSGSDWE